MWAKRPKWEKNICFIRFLHAMGKELLLCSFIGRLLWGWCVWCWSQTELESENVLNWNGQGLSEWVKVTQLCLTFWDPIDYIPWNSPGQNTGMNSLSLLQQIFLTQESNQGLLHWRQILYQLSYQGSQLKTASIFIYLWCAAQPAGS